MNAVNVNMMIDPEAVAISIANSLTDEELLDFLRALDDQVCDLSFTRRAAMMFKRIYDSEMGE